MFTLFVQRLAELFAFGKLTRFKVWTHVKHNKISEAIHGMTFVRSIFYALCIMYRRKGRTNLNPGSATEQ